MDWSVTVINNYFCNDNMADFTTLANSNDVQCTHVAVSPFSGNQICSEQNKTFSMIPHLLHNKEYFWSYEEIYHIFSYYFLCFWAALDHKYLKLIKIDILLIISVFAFKYFVCIIRSINKCWTLKRLLRLISLPFHLLQHDIEFFLFFSKLGNLLCEIFHFSFL